MKKKKLRDTSSKTTTILKTIGKKGTTWTNGGTRVRINGNSAQKISTSNFDASVIGDVCDEYTIVLEKSAQSYLMVGFALPNLVNLNGINYSQNGWFLYAVLGTLYAKDGISCRKYYDKKVNQGGRIKVVKKMVVKYLFSLMERMQESHLQESLMELFLVLIFIMKEILLL